VVLKSRWELRFFFLRADRVNLDGCALWPLTIHQLAIRSRVISVFQPTLSYIMSKDASTAATIPQEMVDAITDQLQASKDWYGLKSFGLVQKSWLSSSRRHLFHTISVKIRNIDWFLEILTVPSRSVTPYVRRLVVNNDHDMLLNKILPVAQPLHAVKSLSIALLSWGDLIPEAKENLISVFKHITFLSIHCVNFDSLSQAVHFITSYPYLEELSLMGGYWRSDLSPSPSQMPDQSGLARLKTLRSFTLDHIEILEWVLRCQPMPPLTTIDFSSHGRSEVNVWGRLIKALGPTLKHLRICHRGGFMLGASGPYRNMMSYTE
jgi:hypothetical protein